MPITSEEQRLIEIREKIVKILEENKEQSGRVGSPLKMCAAALETSSVVSISPPKSPLKKNIFADINLQSVEYAKRPNGENYPNDFTIKLKAYERDFSINVKGGDFIGDPKEQAKSKQAIIDRIQTAYRAAKSQSGSPTKFDARIRSHSDAGRYQPAQGEVFSLLRSNSQPEASSVPSQLEGARGRSPLQFSGLKLT